jgi:hypothetical protein
MLNNLSEIKVHQLFEGLEIVGLETRNRYRFLSPGDHLFAYAAEERCLWGGLARQIVGHWRPFDLFFFNASKEEIFKVFHPFCFFFQEFEIYQKNKVLLATVKEKFSMFYKKIHVYNAEKKLIFSVRSPFWKPWTFPVDKQGWTVALIEKK